MVLHRGHRHEQLACDLLVREPSGDGGGDVTLAGCQQQRPVVSRGRHDHHDPALGRRNLNLDVLCDRRQRRRNAMTMFGCRVDEIDRRCDDIIDGRVTFH